MKLTFTLPSPKASELSKAVSLWSTYYYAHPAKELASGGVPLWNLADKPLGPRISQKDWCLAAMEGTTVIKTLKGDFSTYNYSGKGTSAQTSCKVVFPNLKPSILAGTERVRWKVAKGPFGDGAGGYKLVPYRTLAVDRKIIPLGTVIYIPAARGVKVTLPDGSGVTHDGYFFAADVGGAINGNHVDTFLGITTKNPFPHVKSAAQKTFEAHICTNAQAATFLKSEHQ